MKTVELKLGERDYELPFAIAHSKRWRKVLKPHADTILTHLQSVKSIEIRNLDELIPALKELVPYLIDIPDLITDIMRECSPELEKDWLYLEENASDEEFFDAFVLILKAAFPFGKMAQFLNKIPGQKKAATSKN